jgi:ABC-type multidrug transport system fused ATPase/permease subunit
LKKIVTDIFTILTRKEKNRFIKLVVMDVLVSLLDISFLAILLYLVHFYTAQSQVIAKNVFLFTFLDKHPAVPIIIFFVLFSIKNMFGFSVFRNQFRYVYQIASRLSRNNLQLYFSGSYDDYVSVDSSIHSRKISQYPIEFGHYILGGLQQIISQSILICITITAVLIYNPVLFPLLLIILAPPVILTGILLKKKVHRLRKTAKTINEKTQQSLNEAISGFIESNINRRQHFFVDRYYSRQATLNNFFAEQQSINNMPSRLIEVFAIFGLVILILINSFTAKAGAVKVITIGAFMAAAYKIIPGIVKILNSAGQMKTFGFAIEALLKSSTVKTTEKISNDTPISSVTFKKVFFSYKDEPVLSNFSFDIKKGDMAAISGISGKGKTTIINLLLGFLEPRRGKIFINDNEASETERQQYWNKIAYDKQQPFFIHDSIRNNILLSDSMPDSDKLDNILKITGLYDLIEQYPEGLNTIITENGKNISGGQRQRIMLARALYKDSDLVILDEPFSELDRVSENSLLNYFANLAKTGKIIILITHHKESLAFCNKIISLDERQEAHIYNN